MTYIIMAYDAEDDEVLERRMAARKEHFEYMDENIANGTMIYGAALLDDQDDNRMIGSMIVVNFDSMDAVEAWLEKEPYVINNVWAEAEAIPCKTGTSFEKYLSHVKGA